MPFWSILNGSHILTWLVAYPSEKYESQLGWLDIPNQYFGKSIHPFDGSSHHQPDISLTIINHHYPPLTTINHH